MGFLTREISRILGRPITLYYFKWGDDPSSYYAYTDSEAVVSAPPELDENSPPTNIDYTPAAISRGAITASGSLDRAQLEITAPRNLALASLFIAYPPAQVVTATIRQGHRGETDTYPAIWVGRVTGMRLEGSQAIFTLEPVATSLRRPGLPRNYQYGCPHVLYGTQCRADKPHATVLVTVSDIDDQTIELPADWFGSIALSKYVGGVVQWTTPDGNTEVRTILRRSGNSDLVLGGVIRGLSAGDVVAISLGCNHQVDDCRDLHVEADSGSPPSSNIVNYGGQPWIPLENPVGKSQRGGTSFT